MTTMDEYLADVPGPQRAVLERIRQIVHQTVPTAKEVISYRIPGFKLDDQYLVGFAAFRDHLSLFPTSRPIEIFKDKLGKFKLARGTVRFTAEDPISESLIKEILLARAKDIRGS